MRNLALHSDSITFEVRSTFEKAFDLASEYRQLQLHVQLQEITSDDKSLSQFLQLVKYLAGELSAPGNPLQPSGLMLLLIKILDRIIITSLQEQISSSQCGPWAYKPSNIHSSRLVVVFLQLPLHTETPPEEISCQEGETAISCLCGHFVILSNSRALRFHSIEFFCPLDAVSPLQIY
ncbi:hypothetical protein NC651_005719 [Populus alba x Populus x berolinensis]|nr:hypothetical protein NC651_005719 [Populus alba x Populus x berolinensis]